MLSKVFFALLFFLVIGVSQAQMPKGLYFQNLDSTTWFCETAFNDSNFFETENFGLILNKNIPDTIEKGSSYLYFINDNVVIHSHGDSLYRCSYRLDSIDRRVNFINNNQEVSFQYTPVSTGRFVFFVKRKRVDLNE